MAKKIGQKTKTPMPTEDAAVRRHTFGEVALGYSAELAIQEAARCIDCKNMPCIAGCPVEIDIPGFVRQVAAGDFDGAYHTLSLKNVLPAVCGRVCPQEDQCAQKCTLGVRFEPVAIGRLERFVADYAAAKSITIGAGVHPPTGRKVAIVGSGPAGLTAAADLAKLGHSVTMFEAFHKPGGVLMYGIPEFRLPKAIVQREIETLRAMGVRFEMNFVVGRTRRLRDLLEKDGFDAAFIGSGAGLPNFMNIPGENLVGVFSANEYLTRANLMRAYDKGRAATPIYPSRRVAVLGGGNVAMDSARMAVRLGAEEVHLIYRRTEAEMPARVEEVGHAKEEGVIFHVLENAKRVVGDASGRVTGMECLRYELGAPDKSGRPRPVEIAGSEFMRELDTVIVAIGNSSN